MLENEIIDVPNNTTGIGCSTVKPDRWLAQVGSVGQRSDECNCEKSDELVTYSICCNSCKVAK